MLSYVIAFFAGAAAMGGFCWFIWPTVKTDITAAEARLKADVTSIKSKIP
jgi:hypothetical protein